MKTKKLKPMARIEEPFMNSATPLLDRKARLLAMRFYIGMRSAVSETFRREWMSAELAARVRANNARFVKSLIERANETER